MERRQLVTLTNMCMIIDGTKILVENRKKSDWPGITFLGRYVENTESLTDAVIREVYEETGLTIFKPRLCGVSS